MKKIILLILFLFIPLNVRAVSDINELKNIDNYLKLAEQGSIHYYEVAKEKVTMIKDPEIKEIYQKKCQATYTQLIRQDELRTKKAFGFGLPILLISLVIISYLYFHFRRIKKIKEDEPIPTYSPATVSYLLTKRITDEALLGEVLLVFEKGILELKDPLIKKNKKYSKTLTKKEELICKLLVEDQEEMVFETLITRSKKHYSLFLGKINELRETLLFAALKEEFYKYDEFEFKKPKIQSYLYQIILAFLFLLGLNLLFFNGIFLCFSLVLLIPIIKYIMIINKKPKYAYQPFFFQVLEILLGLFMAVIGGVMNYQSQNVFNSHYLFYLGIIMISLIGIVLCEKTFPRTKKGNAAASIWHRYIQKFNQLTEFQGSFSSYFIISTITGAKSKMIELYQKSNQQSEKNDSLITVYRELKDTLQEATESKKKNKFVEKWWKD